MKIEIIIPPYVPAPRQIRPLAYLDIWMPPLGPATIAAFLKDKGYQVCLSDLSLKRNEILEKFDSDTTKGIIKKITKNIREDIADPDVEKLSAVMFSFLPKDFPEVYGFSVLSRLDFAFALLLAKQVKLLRPTPIVFGGPLITEYANLKPTEHMALGFGGKDLLREYPFIDYIICGEGSVPLEMLLEFLQGRGQRENIPGLMYRSKSDVIINERKIYSFADMPAPDFCDLPLKDYKIDDIRKLTEKDKNKSQFIELPYQITRGCTQRCSFCNFYMVDPNLELKPYKKVINELRLLKNKYKTRKFWFCESKINISYAYLSELCDAMAKERLDIKWGSVASVGGMDLKLLKKMKKAGCSRINWGIESGSDKLLNLMRKGYSSSEASRVLKFSHQAGIFNVVNFITGFPQETNEDLVVTLQFVYANRKYINAVRNFHFAIAWGSPVALYPEKFGISKMFIADNSQIGFLRIGFDEGQSLPWGRKESRSLEVFHLFEKKALEILREEKARRSGGPYQKIKNYFFQTKKADIPPGYFEE